MLDPWRPREKLLRVLGALGFGLDVGGLLIAAIVWDAATHWASRLLLVVLVVGLSVRLFVRTIDAIRRYRQRHAWTNRIGNQWAMPAKVERPRSLAAVSQVVRDAEAAGRTVRAVGSALSFSDVAVPDGVLVVTEQLNAVLPLEHLEDTKDADTLVHIEAGATFRKLNKVLADRGLALANLGGYDGPTVGGAIATGVHGSGLAFGPIADSVVAIVIVASGGRIHRIEPSRGISDADAYRRAFPDHELHQDDDWFHAAVVNLGSLGIVYSVTLRAREAFWLNESRELTDWSAVAARLRRPEELSRTDRIEFFINLYRNDEIRDHRCVETRRVETKPRRRTFAERYRNIVQELVTWLPWSDRGLDAFFGVAPAAVPDFHDTALTAMRDKSYLDSSYRVLNVGAVNNYRVVSAEYSVPLVNAAAAIERLFAVAERERRRGLYFTCPVSLRFVRGTEHFMSMQQGEHDWATIEVALLEGTAGAFDLLRGLGVALSGLGVRWHWGQYHSLDDGGPSLDQRFPRYRRWLEIYRQLNAGGTFESAFTRRCRFAPTTDPVSDP